jgi:hypothetical protein
MHIAADTDTLDFLTVNVFVPIPVAARSKEWVYGRSLVWVAGSNFIGGNGCLSPVSLFAVRSRSLRRADHSPREVLSTVVCV